MRSPSSRVLDGVVDYFQATVSQDAVKSPQYTYPGIPTRKAVPCSAQPGVVTAEVGPQGRTTQEREWKLFLAASINPRDRDQFVYVDRQGVTHTLIAHVERDEAGRGAAFVVHCTEKL